jgi:DNA polymerase-3 subunit alpha
MQPEFIHLRVHSDFSIVDGIIKHKNLFSKLLEYNMPAVGITDECNLYGVIKFYKGALSNGIKPIIGCDFKIINDGKATRLTLLAETQEGFHNLVLLISKGYLEADRDNGIPMIKKEWLTKESLMGMIGLSGGLESEAGQLIQLNKLEQAEQSLKEYNTLFSKDSFFIELQRIGKEYEERYIKAALKIAVDNDIPVVATNNVRFMHEEDYDTHEIRVGIYDGYTLADESRKSKYSAGQYLRNTEEMVELFKDIPSALSNTVAIAKRCNVTFKLGVPVLPKFEIPEGLTEEEYFTQLSFEGLEKRLQFIFKTQKVDQEQTRKKYEERLQIEIDVICQMGFPGYFLIVADFIQWSKDNDIPVGPGRGSGAGSLVAYALSITDIDPMPYDLLFERFLNPERVSMPDFDIDFCMDGRDRVIEYVADKYGSNSVSQIITYGTMAAKAVVRDVGRVLGHPYGFVDKIAKLIPNELGIKLSDACADGTPLRDFANEDDAVETMLEIALKLEGMTKNVGKHAAGVVISPTTVTDFCPIYCEDGSTQLVTQYDKYDVEEAGLVKFDFLGLRNLTIINNAVKIINTKRSKEGKPDVTIDAIPMDDRASFELLKRAETTGIFQLESSGMKELIKRLQPDCFEDIIALVALYRPGPLGSGMVDDFVNCKHGRQEVKYPHPKLEHVLKHTYGSILYQEQVMQIAQVLANYSLGGADILRRAMGKKNPVEMAKQREIFEQGAADNGLEKELAASIFDLMEEFAKYGFNKSHSAAYALVAYQTAWLKAHYPSEFMAALLSSDMDNTDKMVNFILESKTMGVKIAMPHVNQSEYYFTVNDKDEVVYGLGAVKGIGSGVITMISQERQQNGLYKNIFDFCKRIDLGKANKRVLEALTYCGAFDGLTEHRAQTIATLENAIRAAEQHQSALDTGQHDLFGFGVEDAPDEEEHAEQYVDCKKWTFRENLGYEKQVLGLSLSGHLIDEVKYWLEQLKLPKLAQLQPTHRKSQVKFAGVISAMVQRKTKKGSLISILTIDDGTDRMEMMVFTELYDKIKETIKVDDIVMIEGEIGIDSYTDRLRISANNIIPFNQAVTNKIHSFDLNVNINEANSQDIETLLNIIGQNSSANLDEDINMKTVNITCESEKFGIKFKKHFQISDIISIQEKLKEISSISNSEIHI